MMMVERFMAFVRAFLMPSERPEWPGLHLVEVMGHRRHIGNVRLVGGFIEVREDPVGVPEGEQVPVRYFARGAIHGIRPLTAHEQRARSEQVVLEARSCRHCGRVQCPRKGTTGEDVHIVPLNGRKTWCGHYVDGGTRSMLPVSAEQGLVSCGRCQSVLVRVRAGEQSPPEDPDLAPDSEDFDGEQED